MADAGGFTLQHYFNYTLKKKLGRTYCSYEIIIKILKFLFLQHGDSDFYGIIDFKA